MVINKIKSKKPLDRLDDNFVKYFLDEFFKRNIKLKKKFEEDNLKKSDEKIIIKNVRNELNKVYGQFWLKDEHKSFIERKEFINELYKKIFLIIGKPKTILDLGAGLNVLTYFKDIFYYSIELTNFDCELIKKYFYKNNIKGEVIKANLIFERNFPKADVCFMFKILDFFDHKISEELIKCVNCKFIVASFATETVRGRKMNYPRRGWFEVMLKRLQLKFNKFEFKNEIFYIISKG